MVTEPMNKQITLSRDDVRLLQDVLSNAEPKLHHYSTAEIDLGVYHNDLAAWNEADEILRSALQAEQKPVEPPVPDQSEVEDGHYDEFYQIAGQFWKRSVDGRTVPEFAELLRNEYQRGRSDLQREYEAKMREVRV